jgi:hypothetical protein
MADADDFAENGGSAGWSGGVRRGGYAVARGVGPGSDGA